MSELDLIKERAKAGLQYYCIAADLEYALETLDLQRAHARVLVQEIRIRDVLLYHEQSLAGAWEDQVTELKSQLDKSQYNGKLARDSCHQRGEKIHKLETRRRLEKAEIAGIGSMLLQVQQDCIAERRRVKELEETAANNAMCHEMEIQDLIMQHAQEHL